jgi:hypothetical protein
MSLGDELRDTRGWMLGSWRWPLGTALSMIVAVIAASSGSWLTAAIFFLVSVALTALTVVLRRRHR